MGVDQRPVLDIVSLTPMALQTDSRTLKQVISVHRFGYSSAVIEGPPSNFAPGSIPIEVISTLPGPGSVAPSPAPEAVSPLSADLTEPAVTEGPNEAIFHPTAKADLLDDTDGIRLAPEKALERPVRSHVTGVVAWAYDALSKNNGGRESPLYRLARGSYRLARGGYRLARGSYYLVRLIYFTARAKVDKVRIIITVSKNRIVYNERMAFVRHVLTYFRTYVSPTLSALPPARLYYIHSPYQYPAVYLKTIWFRAKHIYDAHDFYSNMDTLETIPDFWRKWVIPFETFVEKRCVRRAIAVVTVNDGLASLIEQKYGVKPLVLRNSHDRRLDNAVDVGIRRRLQLGNDDIVIACVGNWKRENGVSQAIEAMAGLDAKYHLAFLGAGFPDYTTLVQNLGVSARVHFLTPVRPTEVVPFIRSADIGLILYHDGAPGVRWSLPNRFFQPVAAGLPILYPELPEIARLAREHELGLAINTLDPRSIRSGILALASDKELFETCRRNALAAEVSLAWEQDELKLKALIASAIGNPRTVDPTSPERLTHS